MRDPVTKEKVNHATERARLNNADRYFNQRVYDNELKQANLLNQSAMPNTPKDIGVSFKINVYVVRLTQLLGFKADLDKVLTNFFANGVSIQKLRGTTRESQTAVDFFKKGDILSTYNELMLYIKSFAPDLISDETFKSQIFNSSFNPLIQLLQQTATLYPNFFNQMPRPTNAGRPDEKKDERKIYETLREQSIGCYSLFNTMASFMNNLILRPIVKEDIDKYIKDNSVKTIFEANPQSPPIAINLPAPLQPQIQPPPPQQQQETPKGNFFEINSQNIGRAIDDYSSSLNPPRFLFYVNSSKYPNTDIEGVYQSIPNKNPQTPAEFFYRNIAKEIENQRKYVKENVEDKFPVAGQQNPTNIKQSQDLYALMYGLNPPQQQPQQGQPATPPLRPVTPPVSPQQGQQGQPAPAPLPPSQGQSLREHNSGADIVETQSIYDDLDRRNPYPWSDLNQQEKNELRPVIRDLVILAKRLENTKQDILRPDGQDGYLLGQTLETESPNEYRKAFGTVNPANGRIEGGIFNAMTDKGQFLTEFIRSIKNVRKEYARQESNLQRRPDWLTRKEYNTLYGLGHAERNNNLAMNAVFDFENMARRKAQHTDIPTITDITPQMKGYEEQLASMITRLNLDRRLEPSSWGKPKTEYRQGVVQRAVGMPNILEYDPKAEALKRGKIMSGGCDTCTLRGGMNNTEYDIAGYGEVKEEEDTPFKRFIIGMPNPFAPQLPTQSGGQILPYDSRFSDEEDEDYYNEVIPEGGNFYLELEKPVDLDEHADTIRKNNENYKVATGKMKSVKYKN